MKAPYLFDENLKVWIKKDYKSRIAYSDGDEVEQRIFRSVQKSRDVSCLSEELEAAISDWTSLCFLSKKRANLLRPFQSQFKDKRILEVGCGAGPICRFLGESGAQVYGLEPNIQRATIAAERCRDLPNVNIFCDDIANFSIAGEFDGIVMVGVLEYATKYSRQEHAALSFLNNLKKFIKKDTGFIITAIENQLGLKYFSGFAEDHAGAFMHGINDNYRPGEANTYGRKCLLDIFRQAGFPCNDIYLPFPDYKLPSLVFYPGFDEKI
ncbi:MAG TPA: class I SAM-dependent methyltransferase, partial [Chitinophagaceae bacterium]|nr:class I SAM-dependent methyltransferase [Chitinophagaceae bacterium]